MRIRTASAGAALAGCLALAACSGGRQPAGQLGTGDGAGDVPAATTATPAGEAPPPALHLPAGLKLVFEPQQTGDPARDAILADNERLIEAFYQAVDRGDPRDPAFERYVSGQAAATWGRWVQDFKQGGWTATGTDRYFDRVVRTSGAASASVDFCQDQRRVYSKGKKDGRVLVTPATANSFVLYLTVMERAKDGTWRTTRTVAQRGAKQCQ